MKRKSYFKVLALCLVVGAAAASCFTFAAGKLDDQTIYTGVYLDGVYVGGLSRQAAMEEYNQYIEGIEDANLTITTAAGSYSVSLADIGISVSVEDAVDQALNYGRKGNILSRYKEIKALEQESVVLVPEKKIDEDVLRDKLENETGEMVREAKNASITRVDGEFVIQPGEVGMTIQLDDTIQAVEDVLAEEWQNKDIEISAVVEETEPRYTEEDFAAVDSVMGQAVTSYNAGNTNRAQNLTVGAGRVSGTVLMPGEQFSMNETLGPRTEENGYYSAGQYVNNELTDGVGGGICQVSTTLYNAVLKAELQIDERSPHSLTVSYVDRSKDAAIAGDYMDFKFTNDTEYPIYIEGYAGGGTISFAVYGHDTRPANRTIDFESKTIDTIEPGDPEEIMDDTLPEGTRVVEQEAHTGYYAELWKNIYVDGVLTDSVRVNQSQYQATRAKVRVGTMKVESTTEEEDKDKKDKKNKKTTEDNKKTEIPTEVPTEAPTEAVIPNDGEEDQGE